MLRLIRMFALSYLLVPITASAEDPTALSGTWRTVRHGALVTIRPCGLGPCGHLAWADESMTGGAQHDERNRDVSLRGRPLIGVPILWGFTPDATAGGDSWRDGFLYNPDDGKTFRAHLTLVSRNRLKVTGCLGPLCRSQVWTRAGN